MIKPNLEALADQELVKAINGGVYSSVLSSNARMLMDGVLKILKNEIITLSIPPSQLLQRRIHIGGIRAVMDFSVRKYSTLNGLQGMKKEKKELEICKSFHFLWRSGIQDARKTYSGWKLPDLVDKKFDLKKNSRLFSLGLATRDAKQTSIALKFLACWGMASPLERSDVSSFENLVMLHCLRMLECLEYKTNEFVLQHAWPPPLLTKDPTLDEVEDLMKKLETSAEAKLDVSRIADLLKEDKSAVVFGQKVPDAQGPDVVLSSEWGMSGVDGDPMQEPQIT